MLSIIMPYVNEWPQITFTVRAIAEQLRGNDFEIIVIDNYCDQVKKQGNLPDLGHDGLPEDKKEGQKNQQSHMRIVSEKHTWLRYLRYDKKLSHWNAKNEGVKASNGEVLLFLDAHVIPSHNLIKDMYIYYLYKNHSLISLHAPLAYHILEDKRLKYAMKNETEKGIYHYRFCSCEDPDLTSDNIFEVPCMSTCGMMISKQLYNELGGWPESMGIYGGGENFINFTMPVLGYKKYIYNNGTLYHHGDKRNYHWNYNDYHSNRLIATYLFGGERLAKRYALNIGGSKKIINDIYNNAIIKNKKHREKIKSKQKIDIESWVKTWKS